jgi:prophage DNA circulation protein
MLLLTNKWSIAVLNWFQFPQANSNHEKEPTNCRGNMEAIVLTPVAFAHSLSAQFSEGVHSPLSMPNSGQKHSASRKFAAPGRQADADGSREESSRRSNAAVTSRR